MHQSVNRTGPGRHRVTGRPATWLSLPWPRRPRGKADARWQTCAPPLECPCRQQTWWQHVTVIVPSLPMPVRVLAGLIRQDGGRQLGRAVLFASVVGFDVVEKRKADLAAASGVSEARLQEVVDTGRQALSAVSPKRPQNSTWSRRPCCDASSHTDVSG